MFQDLLERPLTSDVEADLCIIGAGAAGLTIARRFIGTGVAVCLIESGGMAADAAVQDMYRGEDVGMQYGIDTSRLRFFGGTTNHWTGVCGLHDPSEFHPRPWIGALGWPFPREELMPFYARAHEVLDLGEFEYDPGKISPERRFPAFDPEKLLLGVLRFSPPTRFNQKYADETGSAAGLHCLLNANVVDFETTHDASRIAAVRIATLNGGEWRVRAKVFVLACGGLENPRLLLNASAKPGGLGNKNGHVGRYFSDHVHHVTTATVVTQSDWWNSLGPMTQGGVSANPMIRLSETIQRRESLPSCRVSLAPTDPVEGARADATCLTVYAHCEQIQTPENRVELSDERDALGLRRVRLTWAMAEIERLTIQRCVVVLAEELGRLKLGSVRLHTRLSPGPGLNKRLWYGSHHMCTTRMSANPEEGVVDRDCRMHDVENLYIAGSSVFPACGQMNPTMTIVALALRLGDHLAERLGEGGAGVSASEDTGAGGAP